MVTLWLPVLTALPCLSLFPLALATSDTCVFFRGNLARKLNLALGLTIPDEFGIHNQCLCASTLPSFIKTNVVAQIAVASLSFSAVQSGLTTIIFSTPGVQVCQYPANSIPACSPDSACEYACEAGFSKHPNGSCRPITGANGAQIPLAGPQCPRGQELCGVVGIHSFQCIDTRSTLDSCGGCADPLPGKPATGRDCSTILGAKVMSCRRGACHVESCVRGYRVSEDAQRCVKVL